jgi:hypothetical protein
MQPDEQQHVDVVQPFELAARQIAGGEDAPCHGSGTLPAKGASIPLLD